MSATRHLSEMQRCLRGTPHNCCTLIVGVSAGSNEQNAQKLSALPVQTFAPKLCNYSETNQKSSVWVIVVIKGMCFLQYNICDWFPPPAAANDHHLERGTFAAHCCCLSLDHLSFKWLFVWFYLMSAAKLLDLKWSKRKLSSFSGFPRASSVHQRDAQNIDFNVKPLYFGLVLFLLVLIIIIITLIWKEFFHHEHNL